MVDIFLLEILRVVPKCCKTHYYFASSPTVSYVNFELGVCGLCMSLVIFAIVVFCFGQSSAQLWMFVKAINPFVLSIPSSDIF